MKSTLVALALSLSAAGAALADLPPPPQPESPAASPATSASPAAVQKIRKSDEEWKKELTAEEYHVLREKGTEGAFSGKYWDDHSAGTFRCAGCGLELFGSDTKFDSGTGWPSFWQPVATNKVRTEVDETLGMRRVEVMCGRCDGHLGHVFDDGPKPTGLRYCINSVSLKLEKKSVAKTSQTGESK